MIITKEIIESFKKAPDDLMFTLSGKQLREILNFHYKTGYTQALAKIKKLAQQEGLISFIKDLKETILEE